MQKNKSSNHHKQDTKICISGKPFGVKEKTMRPSPVETFTINNNGLTNVFSRTISRGYHHIKNTHILGLKHKFITSKVDSNKTKKGLTKRG
jgi:hypothetical protein